MSWTSDLYAQGVGGPRASVGWGRDDVGITGAVYAAQLTRTALFIANLNDDILEQVTDESFLRRWARFAQAWESFRQLNTVPPLVPLPPPVPSVFVLPSAYEELKGYDRQAREWRTIFIQRGGRATTPEPPAPPQGPGIPNPLAPSGGSSPFLWAGLGALLLGGIIILVNRGGE